MKGLNYDDFWMNAFSKDPFGDIPKSLEFSKNYNVKIFSLLWNEITAQSLENVWKILLSKSENNNIKEILPFLSITCIIQKKNKLEKIEKI